MSRNPLRKESRECMEAIYSYTYIKLSPKSFDKLMSWFDLAKAINSDSNMLPLRTATTTSENVISINKGRKAS